ncbi:MAG: phosphomannose isomerase type II C-terminal cupin domain [Nocardioidaceae bacterium]
MSCDSEVRPWGSWQVIDTGDGYKVKRVLVQPGCRLSYQTHQHRSEHWFVVQGAATCTLDDVVSVVRAGESIDVGIGVRHRLANLETGDLVVIEVQRGAYTGEDDIVRLDDDYGRCDVDA